MAVCCAVNIIIMCMKDHWYPFRKRTFLSSEEKFRCSELPKGVPAPTEAVDQSFISTDWSYAYEDPSSAGNYPEWGEG